MLGGGEGEKATNRGGLAVCRVIFSAPRVGKKEGEKRLSTVQSGGGKKGKGRNLSRASGLGSIFLFAWGKTDRRAV